MKKCGRTLGRTFNWPNRRFAGVLPPSSAKIVARDLMAFGTSDLARHSWLFHTVQGLRQVPHLLLTIRPQLFRQVLTGNRRSTTIGFSAHFRYSPSRPVRAPELSATKRLQRQDNGDPGTYGARQSKAPRSQRSSDVVWRARHRGRAALTVGLRAATVGF